MYDNPLGGSIPSELGHQGNLRNLNLWNNGLTGRIPPELGDMTSLQRMNLHGNELAGPIPVELGNLESLVHLNLGGNPLSGPLPAELAGLANLQELWLYDLGGAFPISRSRAHTHRRHGHPLQTVPSAGLIERPQEKNRVDALR